MKLIKPSFEIIEPTGYTMDDIYKSIELAGRVSHKSEDKITETSAKDFVGRMLNMKHLAVCEFGTIYLYIDYHNPGFGKIIDKYNNNEYSKLVIDDLFPNKAYITTNYRVLIENNWLDDLKYLCEPTEYHHKRYTVKFILDRGILAEFTRHRKFSFMAESTRYCVSGDTLLKYKNPNNHYTIRELWEDKQNKNRLSQVLIEVLNIDTGILEYSKIKNIFNNGTRKVYKITTELGYSLKCTLDHQIYTPNDWKSLSELEIGDKIYVNGIEGPIYQNKDWLEYHYLKLNKTVTEICKEFNFKPDVIRKWLHKYNIVKPKLEKQLYQDYDFEVHHKDKNHSNNNPNNLMTVCSSCHQRVHNQSLTSLYGDKIIAITELGEEEVFDLEIENYHNYVANGIIVHNCNYSKGKFNNQLTFIIPCWIKDLKEGNYYDICSYNCREINPYKEWFDACINAEFSYTDLIKGGWKAEQARDILPLSLKTELYMCGFAEDWKYFCKLRDDKQHAHPQAYELAHPLHEEFIKRSYV